MKPERTTDPASKLILQGVHLELTDAMESVMREKLSALLRRNDFIVRLNVRLQKDQTMGTEHHYTATGQIEIGGPDLIASAEGKDAYDVIDGLVEKLERQLERRQGKRKERRNHPRGPDISTNIPKTPA
ncbi:MAG TPA: ribosome-associated translation inhibitor RaiA [Opitutus sp.]|nr:ribosome-associated translation inhibitor RaiA [Opitutus sp.]